MLLLYSEVTMPLYFKSLITMNRQAPRHNACDPGPNCLHPGTQWAKMAQPAIDLAVIPTSYLATFVAWVFSEDHIRYDHQLRHSAHAISSFSHPAQSQQAPRREPSTGTPGPTCQISSKLPGLLAQNQTKAEKNEVKMRFRSIPKILRKIFKFSSKLQFPCVP